MKKLILTTLIAAGLGITAQGAFADNGIAGVALLTESDTAYENDDADGIVQIQGEVVATTCTITGSDGAGQNVNLDLVKAQTSKLKTAGSSIGEKTFTITLKNCEHHENGSTKARAYFLSNPTYVNESGRLINIYSGEETKATKVSIQLLNSDGTAINPRLEDAQASSSFVINDDIAELKYQARYYAEEANVTAGKVLAKVEYYIEYQ